jgi:hypothetical protein
VRAVVFLEGKMGSTCIVPIPSPVQAPERLDPSFGAILVAHIFRTSEAKVFWDAESIDPLANFQRHGQEGTRI